MTTNRELFVHDPTENDIPNLGVAKVGAPQTDADWATLAWELKSFVCEGEYERGLEKILSSFLSYLGKPEQPAVWVSGFYGSGKSHLVRVLEYLWRNPVFPSGEEARSLATLPAEVVAHLRELTTAGMRAGGLWSAAGTLGAGVSQSPRLAFLSVVFQAAGLPDDYAAARFTLWLKQNGFYEAVAKGITAQDKKVDREFANFYVSPVLHNALLKAHPDFAPSVRDVGVTLQAQYSPVDDVSDAELLDTFEQVLELQSDRAGKRPLTLIVLDEMQQYLGEDSNKSLQVQNIVEACSSHFDSQVLFVATGQSALTATPTLQKVQGRFLVEVELSDSDVETVIRQVILRKKPDKVGVIDAALEDASAEVTRELAGTKIGPVAADKPDLIPDYPLLPARRRFWERSLRAIDKAGKAGVLRTQLKLVHEAAQSVANEPVGTVVAGDYLYDAQFNGMLQSGVLLKEIDELIRKLRDGTPDGNLKSRLCALIFLINQLPQDGVGDTGVRATAPMLADLLVQDLAKDGADFRKRVPDLLEQLTHDGRLMKLDDQYALETEEGATWREDYNQRRAAIRADAQRMVTLRDEWLLRTVDVELKGLSFQQGKSKTPRKMRSGWDQDPPAVTDGAVPVWFRDGWSVDDAAVQSEAAALGHESPVVHVLLPAADREAIADALAGYAAATETLNQRPVPQTDEGRVAKNAMETQLQDEERQLRDLFSGVASKARVFQSGGGEISEGNLRASLQAAVEAAVIRLFPKFGAADNAEWGKVITKARDGDPDAIGIVGHAGAPAAHPVCKDVLGGISAAGVAGAEIQKQFGAPPYGWPKDAINGAVLALMGAGHILARRDGSDILSPKELPQSQIGNATLVKQDDPPGMEERIAVRGLLADADIQYETGAEGAAIPALLQELRHRAAQAGGPPPLPPVPEAPILDELQQLSGNRQFREVAKLRETLYADLVAWTAIGNRVAGRQASWDILHRLLRHADGLPFVAPIVAQRDAIESQRLLLDEVDPVAPLLDEVGVALRAELKTRVTRAESAQHQAKAELASDAEWQELDPADAATIEASVGLAAVVAPNIATDHQLLTSLDDAALKAWDDRADLFAVAAQKARVLAAKKLEPASVSFAAPSATLKTAADVDTYVNDLRARLLEHIARDERVVI